jgi:hypothetical protein
LAKADQDEVFLNVMLFFFAGVQGGVLDGQRGLLRQRRGAEDFIGREGATVGVGEALRCGRAAWVRG